MMGKGYLWAPSVELTHQPDSPYKLPRGNLKPSTSTALELMHIVALWWSCYFTAIMLHGTLTKREREITFLAQRISALNCQRNLLWVFFFFFFKQNLCSHLNNSSAFQCLWVLFVWMVRDFVDRDFFFLDGEHPCPVSVHRQALFPIMSGFKWMVSCI